MRVFVLADDLTGGNAAASLLKREGLPSQTLLLGHAPWPAPPAALREDGAHVLDLETRDLPADIAAARIGRALAWLPPDPTLLALRIDSTLRGPIAASLDAVLADAEQLALVVPAFPASGRTTRDGVHRVFGVPLAATEVAQDPHCPIGDSRPVAWVGGRMAAAAALLPIGIVREGDAAVSAQLLALRRDGARAVFCDAERDAEIDTLARAALRLTQQAVSVVPVDPGPFTASMVRHMLAPVALQPLVFGVVGSVMATSRQQMDHAQQSGRAFTLRYEGQDAAALLDAFAAAPPETRAMLLRTDTALLDTAGQEALHQRLAELFGAMIARFPSLRGFLLSGGETAGRLLASVGVCSLRLECEVMPLITLSRIVDGALAGRFLVTKGGTVGPEAAITDAIGRLYDVLCQPALALTHASWPARSRPRSRGPCVSGLAS